MFFLHATTPGAREGRAALGGARRTLCTGGPVGLRVELVGNRRVGIAAHKGLDLAPRNRGANVRRPVAEDAVRALGRARRLAREARAGRRAPQGRVRVDHSDLRRTQLVNALHCFGFVKKYRELKFRKMSAIARSAVLGRARAGARLMSGKPGSEKIAMVSSLPERFWNRAARRPDACRKRRCTKSLRRLWPCTRRGPQERRLSDSAPHRPRRCAGRLWKLRLGADPHPRRQRQEARDLR